MYQYKDFVQNGIDALNRRDFDALMSAELYSASFTKYLLPASLQVEPETLEQWRQDLTVGFVAQNYKTWKAELTGYWEDKESRSCVAWCHEAGMLVDDKEYAMDYVMRYEFDQDGKLKALYEYNDALLQSGIFERWMKRLESSACGHSTTEPPKARFILFSEPRTASNLLVKMLNVEQQPRVVMKDSRGYCFMPAITLAAELKLTGKNMAEWSQQQRDRMAQCFQECYNDLASVAQKATEEKKIFFHKEHVSFMINPAAQSAYLYEGIKKDWKTEMEVKGTQSQVSERSSLNKTVLPDDFLRSFQPIFLIRHPALVIPSHLRAHHDTMGLEYSKAEMDLIMSLHWQRDLWQFYAEKRAVESQTNGHIQFPVIIDADDMITNPELVTSLANAMGLDAGLVRFQWNQAEDNKDEDKIACRYQSSLRASTGILKDKAAGESLNIPLEGKKWEVEFGAETARNIEIWVQLAMPHYNFLRERRLHCKEAYVREYLGSRKID